MFGFSGVTKYCSDSLQEWTDCWDVTTNKCKSGQDSNCKSFDSNDFAVRPDKFDMVATEASPYKAGKNYDIKFYAKDGDGDNAVDFNETIPFEYSENKAECKTGSYDSNVSTMMFDSGLKEVSLAYSEVGYVNLKMQETLGSEFAKIDAGDTVDSDRFITP